MSCWPKHIWPTQIPNLIPLYYAMWAHVKGKALRVCQSNVDALKANTNNVWANMYMVDVAKICLALMWRMEKCMDI